MDSSIYQYIYIESRGERVYIYEWLEYGVYSLICLIYHELSLWYGLSIYWILDVSHRSRIVFPLTMTKPIYYF